MFYQKMLARNQKLEDEIQSTKELIATFPEGEFFCFKNDKYYKWYLKTDDKRKIINKKEKTFAEQMAVKKYHSMKLSTMEHEKKAIEAYLKKYDPAMEQEDSLIDEGSNYKQLLDSHFSSFSQELVSWVNAPYEKNPKNPEKLTHKTANGLMVRSKSEAMIAKLLYMNKIPFRYECALVLDGKTLYPDFTIIHPKTGELFYWEHWGMMDNPRYREYVCSKFERFVMNGIIPSIHMIITYENGDNPFSIEAAEDIIRTYFL